MKVMSREIRGLLVAGVVCILFGGFILLAPAALRQKPPAAPPAPANPALPAPTTPPAAPAAEGRSLYMQSCAECHAADASGDEGPDLRHLAISHAHVALVVTSGIKGEMPSFQKKYGPNEIAAIQAYLDTLR
jgi:mono/diheme cytochrome c family protein